MSWGWEKREVDLKQFDKVEKEDYDFAMAALPYLAASHVLLEVPQGLGKGVHNVELRGSRISTAETSYESPYLVVSGNDDAEGPWQGQGAVSVPMDILRKIGQRLVLHAFKEKPWVVSSSAQGYLGCCYVALEPRGAHGVLPLSTPVCAEGSRIFVSLLGTGTSKEDKPVKVGDLAFSCRWPGGPGPEESCFPLPKQEAFF